MPTKQPPFVPVEGRVYRSTPSSKGHGFIRIDALVGEDRVKVTSYHPTSAKIKQRTSVALVSSYGSGWMTLLAYEDEPLGLRSAEGLRIDREKAAAIAAEEAAKVERERAEQETLAADLAAQKAKDEELTAFSLGVLGALRRRGLSLDTSPERAQRSAEEQAASPPLPAGMVGVGWVPAIGRAMMPAAGEPAREETQAALAFVTDPAPDLSPVHFPTPAPATVLPAVTWASRESDIIYERIRTLFTGKRGTVETLALARELQALALRALDAARTSPTVAEFAPA
jgi:hypothetical protein